MSSSYIRTQIKTFLAANAPSETVVDLSGRFEELEDLLRDEGINNQPWVGVQFVGNDENPVTIGSNNTHGKFRETGAVFIHTVDVAKLGGSDTILARAEVLRDLFRGRKLGTMFVESVSPPNSEAGAALQFSGGYMCFTFVIGYLNDKDL